MAKRAEDLAPGVHYVRGWNRALRSAGTLADQRGWFSRPVLQLRSNSCRDQLSQQFGRFRANADELHQSVTGEIHVRHRVGAIGVQPE
ncbi:hypothetical protein ACWD3Z_18350 [Streptomyces sp. NPDC002740]